MGVDVELPAAVDGPRTPYGAKNMLLGAGTVAASMVFVVVGTVDWPVVVPPAVGPFAGSLLGPLVVRHVPATAARWTVGALGLALAVRPWVDPG